MVKHTDTHKAFLIKLGGMISSQNSKCKWVRINHKEPKYLHFVSIFVKRNRGKVVFDLIEENPYTRQKEFTGKYHRPICEQQLNLGKILPNPRVCCCSAAQLCLTLCDLWDCSMPAFPVLLYLLDFAQTHVHWRNIQNINSQNWPSMGLPFKITLALRLKRVKSKLRGKDKERSYVSEEGKRTRKFQKAR